MSQSFKMVIGSTFVLFVLIMWWIHKTDIPPRSHPPVPQGSITWAEVVTLVGQCKVIFISVDPQKPMIETKDGIFFSISDVPDYATGKNLAFSVSSTCGVVPLDGGGVY